MVRRSFVMLLGPLVLVMGGCSASHPRSIATTAPASTTSTTSTTRPPTVAESDCRASTEPDRTLALGRSVAWIQMVSSRRGYAVMGGEVVGTADGRSWAVLYRAPEDLGFVDAVDSAHVWVVGSRSFFASSDGGRHWAIVPVRTAPLTMVHFTDVRDGWGVVNRVLVRTFDGGRSWQRTTTPCPADRTCFDDAQHGWIATIGAVYETSDGGARWSRALTIRDPSAATGVASDLQCAAGGSAWVLFAGYGAAAGNAPYIVYRCAHAAACVAVVKQNLFPPSITGIDGPGSYPGPFSIIDDHTAVFVGNTPPLDQPITMMLLADDGRSHGPRYRVPDGSSQEALARSVSFTSRDVGWIVDQLGIGPFHILATTNGGRTWSVQFTAPAP